LTRDDVHGGTQALSLEIRAMGTRLEARIDELFNRQLRWLMASQLVLGIAIVGSITTIPH
jgi:hypothetical protein